MQAILLPLNGDVETHGAVIGAPTAWQAIDEDPDDGDTTRIRINSQGAAEASSIDGSPLPDDAVGIVLRVRWNASGVIDALDPTFAQAGLRVGGVDYYAAPRGLDPTGAYAATSFEETFTTNPATMSPWTVDQARAVAPVWVETAGSQQPGRPRLTQRVLYADYDVVDRPSGEPESLASEATPEALAPSAAGAGMAPEATGASRAPAASVAGLAPTSKPVSIVPSADPSTRAPMADPAKLNTYSARPVALAPAADAVALQPAAAPVALDPEGTGE